jgi:hypothetical protein
MCEGGEKLYVVKMVFQKHDIDAFWLHWNMLLTYLEKVCQGPGVKDGSQKNVVKIMSL